MKNMTRHIGTLTINKKLKNSLYGNPRFEVSVDGVRAVTKPNSSLAYFIENYEGMRVEALICTFRGKATIFGCHAFTPYIIKV